MAIADNIKNALVSSSMIRKMFEEGMLLKKEHGADNVFDFSLGNPDIEPPAAFHDIFVKLAQEDEKGSHGYMPNAGYTDVRESIARKVCKEQNVKADGSDIVMACGAAGGLNTVFKTICNPGDEVIVSRPFFMEYRPYTANHGAVLIEIDSKDDFDIDIDAIKKVLSNKTAAVLINSPNNPTGKIYSAQTLASLASVLKEHGRKSGRLTYMVSDEPYREIAYDCEVPPVLSCCSESIVVSSYSKSLSLPGERIGFIAVNPEISGKDDLVNGLIYATRILGYVNAPALMQRIVGALAVTKEACAAAAALVDVSIYAKRRDAFIKILDEVKIEYAKPQGAFYLFCKVPESKNLRFREYGNDRAFAEHLKKYLILGVPGTGFGKSGWLRFAYCVDEKIISASASAFKKAMEDW